MAAASTRVSQETEVTFARDLGLFIYFMYFAKVTAADIPQVIEVQQSKSASTYSYR